jgi:hypothetical protein
MKYYYSKIDDISAIEVRSVFDDLCRAVRWPIGEQYGLVAWKWLELFFKHSKRKPVTKQHVACESPLTTPIVKMSKTQVYVFCRELCEERRLGFELYEQKTVLTLLKKIYTSPQMRLHKK